MDTEVSQKNISNVEDPEVKVKLFSNRTETRSGRIL